MSLSEMFRGTGVALVTPFDTEGAVDFSALTRLVEYQLENGTDFLVVLGTTGEPATMSADEKSAVVEHVLKVNGGKLPVMLGLGGNNTSQVCRDLQETSFEGIDAILSVVPYYNKPTQEGIYQHYMALSEVTPLPILLYNVPSRTGVSMSAETTIRLANSSDKFFGVKEASGDLVSCSKIVKETSDDFLLISGEDALTLPMMSVGAKGVISVSANAMPKKMADMVSSALDGNYTEGAKLHLDQLEIFDLIFAEGNPCGVKAALAELGIMEKGVRLPLVESSEELTEQIADQLQCPDSELV